MLLRTVGKSLLISTGFAYGFFRSARLIAKLEDSAASQRATDARLATLELAAGNLNDQTRRLEGQLELRVTRADFVSALDEAFGQLRAEAEHRYRQNARSIEALREMVGQTDELLQKVLDGLEETREASQAVA